MDYHTKYLKYKNKYLELKGGFINKPQYEDDTINSIAVTNKTNNNLIYNIDTDLFYDEPKITKIEFLKILNQILVTEDTKLTDLKNNTAELEKNKRKITIITQNIEILKKISEKSKLEPDDHLFSYLQKENIPGGQKIDATINQQFNEKFNQYLQSLSDKYNEVFSSIVPINDNFFPILRHKEAYSIYLQNTNSGLKKMYEIYFKGEHLKRPDEKFILDDNFKFNKIYPLFEILKYDEKYPLINNAHLLQAYILTANRSTLESLLIFYAKYFKDDFTNWFKSYGFIDTKTQQIIYYYKPNIMCSFILAHQIVKFYYCYLEINYSWNYHLMESTLSRLPELTPEEKEDVKKAIDSTNKYKSEVDKILMILRKIIIQKDHPKEHYITILKYSKYLLLTEPNKDFINFIIYTVIIINLYQNINETNQLFSAYNFLRINNKYNETMKQIDKDTDFYKSIKELNGFIKLSFEQNKNLFFIDLVEELYYYKVLKNKAKDSSFLESILLFLFINYLDNHPILSKVQNIQLHFVNFSPNPIIFINKSGDNLVKSHFSNPVYNLLMDFYANLFFSKEYLIGLKFCNYSAMDDKFIDPRGLVGSGLPMVRPMCGEVTILNFINALIWNATEKKLDPEYLPETSIEKLKTFYTVNQNNLLLLEREEIYTPFFELLRDIPFTLSDEELEEKSIRKNIRDYGDNNINSPYRYYTKDANHTIIKGNELRVTYKNMCRVLAHLFNKKDLFTSISADILNDNTLKDIIMMFRNPIKDNLIMDYNFEGDYVHGVIKFDSFKFDFGYHSESTINTGSDTSLETIMIDDSINNYIFHKNNFSNIPEAIFSAKIKGKKSEHTEFDFKVIDDKSLITYLNVLATIDNYYIDVKLIYNLLKNKKTNVLKHLFKELIVYNKNMWLTFLSYIIAIDDPEHNFFINKYLDIVKRNKFKSNEIIFIYNYIKSNKSSIIKLFNKLDKYINIKDIYLNRDDFDSIKEFIKSSIKKDEDYNKYTIIILLIEEKYDKLLELIKKHIINFTDIINSNYESKHILNKEFINKMIEFFRDDSNKKYLYFNSHFYSNLLIDFLFEIQIQDKLLVDNFSRLFGFLVKKSKDNYPAEFEKFLYEKLFSFLRQSTTSIENEELKFFTYKKFNIIFEKITIDTIFIDKFKPALKEYIENHKLNKFTITSNSFKNFIQFNRFISFNNNITISDLF
jgi:hypothetical protein